MTKKEFSLLFAVKKLGMVTCKQLAGEAQVSVGFTSENLKAFREKGLTDEKGITEKGLGALEPYKVRNAVIMAAGMSS